MKQCWACANPLIEDVTLRGIYVCTFNRCVRYGVLSKIYLSDEDLLQEEEVKKKEENGKDLPKS